LACPEEWAEDAEDRLADVDSAVLNRRFVLRAGDHAGELHSVDLERERVRTRRAAACALKGSQTADTQQCELALEPIS
jgi:hypothetical protein